MEYCPFTRIQEGLNNNKLTAEYIAHEAIKHITNSKQNFNAITYIDRELTSHIAEAADKRLAKGERGPMLGIPIILKDNINWQGTKLSNGSKIMNNYISPYNATVVQRLLNAGAVPIAKANMDEFAMGSSGEYSIFGLTRNPWNSKKVAGGSSSGSAASISAGYVPCSLGTDTGGSVRLPGSFCNVTALRPSYGILSRYGVTALASSLDQIGPMATCVKGVASLLITMCGMDKMDSTSMDLPHYERLRNLQPANLKSLRIGIPREYFTQNIDNDTQQVIHSAIKQFQDYGAQLIEVSLPHSRYAIDIYYIINTSEAYSNMAQFDGIRYGNRQYGNNISDIISHTRSHNLGREVKRRILIGAFCLSKGHYNEFYQKASKARNLIVKDFNDAMKQVDVIVTPTYPGKAFSIGDKTHNPIAMYLADMFTVTPSLAALPAISIPAGFISNMPIGLQLIGKPLSDVHLLEIAQAFQMITNYHTQQPHEK